MKYLLLPPYEVTQQTLDFIQFTQIQPSQSTQKNKIGVVLN